MLFKAGDFIVRKSVPKEEAHESRLCVKIVFISSFKAGWSECAEVDRYYDEDGEISIERGSISNIESWWRNWNYVWTKNSLQFDKKMLEELV